MLNVGECIKKETVAEVVGNYDVVVCGGGTAGCTAAIAAARCGSKVALIEKTPFLGGMLTEGNVGITKFIFHGKNSKIQSKINDQLRKDPKSVQIVGGIPLEIANTLLDRGAALGTGGTAGAYVYTDQNAFKLLLFELLRNAGVEIFLHSVVCDVVKDRNTVAGVVTQTKSGRCVYGGKIIVDCTGDADVAVLSGAEFSLGVGENDAVYKQNLMPKGAQQAMGMMFRIGGVDFDKYVEYLRVYPENFREHFSGQMSFEEFMKAYDMEEAVVLAIPVIGWNYQIYNYPHKGILIGMVSMPDANEHGIGNHINRNGIDVDELTRCEYELLLAANDLVSKLKKTAPGFENAFVLDTPSAGIRETRHIVGEYQMNIEDILNHKEFTDVIGKGSHPIDVFPFPEEIKRMVKPKEWSFDIPYGCMVPKGIDNMLVAGRCVSATREAYGCIRPAAQCMILGEAAGTAASILTKTENVKAKDIDVKELRKRLKENGVIL